MASLLLLKHRIPAALAACAVAAAASAAPPASGAKTALTAINSVIDFGSFAVLASCANCSVTISPNGARTASGGVVLTSANAGRAGTYSVIEGGCSCKPYTAAVTPTSVTQTAGGVPMTVGAFTTAQSAAMPPNTLSVGATLTIPSSASAGTYSGWSYTITTTP